METDENFQQFKSRFEALGPAKQIQVSVYMALIIARALPRDKFGDMLDAGMKLSSYVFTIGILDKVFEVQEDQLLRPALSVAILKLIEHTEKLQLRFANLMELIDDIEEGS